MLGYKIIDSVNKKASTIDTYIMFDYLGRTKTIYSGISTYDDIHKIFKSGQMVLDIQNYLIAEKYWFIREWIKLVLYRTSIESIGYPNKDWPRRAIKKIVKDLLIIKEPSSFISGFYWFAHEKYIMDPMIYNYNNIGNYIYLYKLFRGLLIYQLVNYSLLHKHNYNLNNLIAFLSDYENEDLSDSFRFFIEYDFITKDILNDQDYRKLLRDELFLC